MPDPRFLSDQFPRSSKYNPDWIAASVSGGANPLWLAEWLTESLELKPGMRVLDLGCGRAMSSIFLHREFGVKVWAADLWIDVSENAQRIRDAGVADSVFPLHADARSLPFATDFFDAVVSIDSYFYYGTDDMYLTYLSRFIKPGGSIGIAGVGVIEEFDTVPEHLSNWWTPDLCCIHSADWWSRHWRKSGIVDVDLADTMPDGWQRWLDWHRTVAPNNEAEINALEADRGRYLGYVRAIARRKASVELFDPIGTRVPPEYSKHPLLRDSHHSE